MNYEDTYLDQVRRLKVNRSGERRAPHKPLLLLIGIAKLLSGERELPFGDVESLLTPLLQAYAPAVQGRCQPELPYWHLRNDKIWDIPDAESFPLQSGGFPQMAALRASVGHLEERFAAGLLADPGLVQATVATLLEEHFPESLHADILAAVGMTFPEPASIADRSLASHGQRRRDPRFRQAVLRAYEHRCAITGFRAALGGLYLGCEAAHVQWHAYSGPDTVSNGFAVEPTLHKLFDAGAWSLTDDRRILVSAELTGTDTTVTRIRRLHGELMRAPLPGAPEVSVDFIHWHRDQDQGGVFRHPALPL
jgi:putative restriction endonuclease